MQLPPRGLYKLFNMAAAQLERILANLLVPDNTVIQQVKLMNFRIKVHWSIIGEVHNCLMVIKLGQILTWQANFNLCGTIESVGTIIP